MGHLSSFISWSMICSGYMLHSKLLIHLMPAIRDGVSGSVSWVLGDGGPILVRNPTRLDITLLVMAAAFLIN
ncbi:hypothetical protein GDO78_018126 [Eleutherodactylus coqui]|uniref:Uncharacterized protein n=1 Tax=Eleutherodactylus coqui TaxID=57060 RepID=A0A8J6EJW3_ELECQ|nr:hypothetical protein GDO78_018126 [Eleutherodactylus coqui]